MNLFICIALVMISFLKAEENVSVREDKELYQAIRILHAAASEGGSTEAIELWEMGDLIELYSDLRKIAPLNVRADLLKKAADNGSSEASFNYSIYSLRKLNNTQLFLKYIKDSSSKSHVMATITIILIKSYIEKNAAGAMLDLEKVRNAVPKEKLDVFDSRININTIKLLTNVIRKNDLAFLQSTAESSQEMELLSCIQIFRDYEKLLNR